MVDFTAQAGSDHDGDNFTCETSLLKAFEVILRCGEVHEVDVVPLIAVVPAICVIVGLSDDLMMSLRKGNIVVTATPRFKRRFGIDVNLAFPPPKGHADGNA